MAWDFSTDPEFQRKLDWAEVFVEEKVVPLEALFPDLEFQPLTPERRRIVDPLKQEVRDHGLWAPHLDPELGGQGFGAVKLTLINEILGRAGTWASVVFGTMAPDTGNAEILARFGTPEQKDRYLEPLLSGEIFSCFSMTEPQGGADPRVFTTRAVRAGDEWVINGLKYFSSNVSTASFLIVMALTDPDVPVQKGTSMFLVPRETEGIVIEENHQIYGHAPGAAGHGLVRYTDVRVPLDAMLGDPGNGFGVAQSRLAGGRIHHAMRAIGYCRRLLDMAAERALSRKTAPGVLADKQFVQGFLADSYTELLQFRMAVLYTAWIIETQGGDAARKEIAALKIATPKLVTDAVHRTIQLHGGLGLTAELPLARMWTSGMTLGLADGPTEVHKVNLAKALLRDYKAVEGLWPSEMRSNRLAEAHALYGDLLD
ncbi:acyl-CoA dehydrogenase family protein [Nocardia jinanensis]|uniref:Acyl-CoA dehydrogenase n=1 Tax=Nocardia jinanensis TaxID=382504 RepID=A0A917RL22_9NOCA|nr:acyl-CoA dehydrogenase family protein [Nocardia jinanensis]GGL12477.1 acyl-CoA dehydrogenase [Nocardia jinanensis]